jgi:small subunit ribosomal protein S3
MTHTVHPYSHRLGGLRDWKSRWFGTGKQYKDFLRSDVLLRQFLENKLRTFHVSSIEVERSEKMMRIIIKTSRPGLIIGRSGEGAVKLRKEIEKFMRKSQLVGAEELKIDVEEVRSPESDASIVAQMIRDGLERRLPFRRVMKQTVEKVMANRNVKGVRILLSGRLGGAEMSRKEQIKRGRIPLQTFRADIDYSQHTAKLPYGVIGVKVWIYRGEIFSEDKRT